MQIDAFKDGVFAIRTHTDLRLKASPKDGVKQVFGDALNSEGDEAKAVWGKRADWVHYFGTVDGKPAGIAFLSHPTNPSNGKQKAWWHARDYGLISANPFCPRKKLKGMAVGLSPKENPSISLSNYFFTPLTTMRLPKGGKVCRLCKNTRTPNLNHASTPRLPRGLPRQEEVTQHFLDDEVCLCNEIFRNLPLEDAFQKIAEIGYDGRGNRPLPCSQTRGI